MRIGVIGAGHIGGTLARLFAAAGHDVAVSNSRGPDTLRELEADLGGRGRAVTPAEAAAFGDVVVVSIPLGRYRELPAEALAGKVVIDTNNYYPHRDGHFPEVDEGRKTSSELLQEHAPAARVVKAFNSMNWTTLRDQGRPHGDPERIGVPMSGDDPDAKQPVARLADDIGFDAVDAGTLADGGREHQQGGELYGVTLTNGDLRARLAA